MPVIDDQALEAYIQAVSFRAKAEVCALYVSDFKPNFEHRFEGWQNTKTELLARGVVVARERGMSASKPPGIEAFARMEAELLSQLPADDRTRRCNELLESMVEGRAR